MQQAFEVLCTFLIGSKARGCFLALNGKFGNYLANISRDGGSAKHTHTVGGSMWGLTYSVFDWEEDGSVGSVAVPVQLINDSLTVVNISDPAELTGMENSYC